MHIKSIKFRNRPSHFCVTINYHFGGQISIAFNEINGNGSIYYALHKANDLIFHCWNLNVMFL